MEGRSSCVTKAMFQSGSRDVPVCSEDSMDLTALDIANCSKAWSGLHLQEMITTSASQGRQDGPMAKDTSFEA